MDNRSLFAFVLMPFDSQFDDLYKFGVKEPAAQLDIIAERVDEQIYSEGILERIYRQIEAADIIVADMTGQNPNVFYEVGYAHAKEKPCILLTKSADDIPFDLKHRRHIVHNGSIQALKKQLLEDLTWAKGEIENIRKSHIQVSTKVVNSKLSTTKWTADAEITFTADLRNDSDRTSPDIEAAYLYSGEDWTLTQDGKACASTEADIPPFMLRHFLTTPVSRLRPNQWAQIKYTAKKTLAETWKGEELKDSYRVSGRSVLRLITSEGSFDYELPIDVTVEEFPF